MFDKLKQWIGGIWNTMLGKNIIEDKLKVKTAITTEQQNMVSRWTSIMKGNPPWITEEYPYTMDLGQTIADKYARLATIEMKSEIINNDFLNEEYQREVINDIRNTVQYACGGGAICFKPYLTMDGHIAVDVVQADNFYPVSFLRGRAIACVLPEYKVKGEDTYTRLESHTWDAMQKTYTIENKVFKKKTYDSRNSINDGIIGDEVPLNSVEEWSNLAPTVTFENILQPLFVYFKMPIADTKNPYSKLGVSIFADVAKPGGLLEQADKQYSRALWEYEGGELAIHAAEEMFKKNPNDPRDFYVPNGKERLYRKLNIDIQGDKAKPIDVFSPEFRDTSIYNGLNKLLQQIEIKVGLAKGTFSDLQEIAKTATEIKSTKQDTYQTVKDIQKYLTIALKQLAYAMYAWAKIGQSQGIIKEVVNPIDVNKEISFDYDDSILIDRETELKDMQTDVSLGLLDPVYYIMEKYKLTEEEARKRIPQQTTTGPDPYANSEE
jgi:A118 family predicted phage portal protein